MPIFILGKIIYFFSFINQFLEQYFCYFYRFNVCCLLGLSCIGISFGVCSLSLITDLPTFYLTSLILGIGLAVSYNGKEEKIFQRLEKKESFFVNYRYRYII